MKHSKIILLAIALSVMALTGAATAQVKTGDKAPDFSLKSADGKTYKLSSLKGKHVVLEWVNYGCPFVRKHYDSDNMQSTQRKWTGKDVVWLAINSSAPGKQGFYSAADALKQSKAEKSAATAYLLDSDGKVGRLYDAKTTPAMYVINADGILVYKGAIDSIRSADASDIKKAKNYVDSALTSSMAGKKVEPATTQSYGCGVKY